MSAKLTEISFLEELVRTQLFIENFKLILSKTMVGSAHLYNYSNFSLL